MLDCGVRGMGCYKSDYACPSKLHKFLSVKGLIAVERLMGMVLVAISVQMLLDGITTYLSVIPSL